jgi:uncharacterized protein
MEKTIIDTENYVKRKLRGDSSGHDWWHIFRVRNSAMMIASKEKGADKRVVELSALLHDVADWKFNDGDPKASSRCARAWLRGKVEEKTIEKVCNAIDEVSFKGAGVKTKPSSLEGMIVQDADRLDALGAIGIGRAFAYGGKKGREMHSPYQRPTIHKTFKSYKNSQSTTINHFHEKLLLLKGLMNTQTAKKMAEEREKFMIEFLERFQKEWDGKT